MEQIPLLKSKLMIPELPEGVLHTDRIKKLPIQGKRAVIITAPGGFGKTTAVLLALKKEVRHTYWYRLEKEDGLLPVFYNHLIETLFPVEDKNTLGCFRALSGVSSIMEEYPLINALICQDAWEQFGDDGLRRYLVLDDYQNIAENTVITETMRYFISNLPDSFELILLSRVDAGVLTGKVSLLESVSCIGEEDLRFTREESGRFLLHTCKMDATAGELDRIQAYTEGWIAGLYLIGHSGSVPSFTSEPANHSETARETMFSLFFRDFLAGMDEKVLIYLAKMSVFPDFSEKELKEVLEIDDPASILNFLEKSNLYIQKFMTQPVKYRFHSLFRMEIETYLKRIVKPGQMNELYLRAAQFYETSGDLGAAIRLYKQAGRLDLAVDMMRKTGSRVFATGNMEKVMYYVTEFPDQLVQNEPYLLFFKGCMLLTSDIEKAYECFRTALLMFRYAKDMHGLMNSFGMILVMSYQTNNFRYVNETAGYIPRLRVAFSKSEPRKKLIVTAFINLVASEKLKIAARMLKLLGRIKLPEQTWEYSYSVIRGMLLYRIGQLDESKSVLYQVLNHPVALSSDKWRIIGLVGCHLAACFSGDINAAKALQEEFSGLGETYDSDHCRAFAFRISSLLKQRAGDIRGAALDAQRTVDMQRAYGSPLRVSAELIGQYVWECELAPSKDWVDKAEEEFLRISKQEIGQGYYELSQARVGFICKSAGYFDRAEELLRSAYEVNRRKGAKQHTAMLAAQLADLYYQKSDSSKSDRYLKLWAKLSEKNEYVYLYLLDHGTLIRCCALAIQKNICAVHMRKILAHYYGEENTRRIAGDIELAVREPHNFFISRTEDKKESIHVSLFGDFTL